MLGLIFPSSRPKRNMSMIILVLAIAISHAWSVTFPRVLALADYDEIVMKSSRSQALEKESFSRFPSMLRGGLRSSHKRLHENDLSDMRVIIMTMDRRDSFMRLWRSLERADYLGDRIDVDVWVDRNSTNQIADADFLREISRLRWAHGKKRVHVWKRNAGIRKQWIDTWFLSAGSSVEKQLRERAVILEDDLSVSPLFYKWLKLAHESYEDNDEVVAYTLTRASLCPAKCGELHGGPGPEDAATQFLSPLVGSWGLAPKASHWVAFRNWYHEAIASNLPPYVEGLVTTEWYKIYEEEHREQNMWTAFHIKYVDLHLGKMYLLYVKAPRNTTLASNHKEKGLHYLQTSAKPDYPLLTKWDRSMGYFPRQPAKINWNGTVIY